MSKLVDRLPKKVKFKVRHHNRCKRCGRSRAGGPDQAGVAAPSSNCLQSPSRWMAMNPRPDSADTAIVACYFGLARRPSLNADYEHSDVLASQASTNVVNAARTPVA